MEVQGGGHNNTRGVVPCGGLGGASLPGATPINPVSPGSFDLGSIVGFLDNKLQLTSDEEDFLDSQEIITLVLYDFLWTNEYSNEAKDFAKEAIDALMDEGDVNFEERIIQDKSVTPCVKNILKDLMEKDSHHSISPDIINGAEVAHLSQTILDLFDASSNYHLNFKVGDATDGNGTKRNAFTDVKSGSIYNGQVTFEITLDQNYIKKATQLAIARTIVHESIHAFLSYSTSTSPESTFAVLIKNYKDENNNTNDAHHELMNQFADALGESLAAWDNHQLSQDYYNSLGWSGDMLDSEAFERLSSSEKQKIKDANKAEGDAVNSATNKAKGTKCN